MRDSVTFIYPDGTIIEEPVDTVPEVGERVGALVVARVETKGPDDEVDTGAWVYLREVGDETISKKIADHDRKK